MNIHSLQAIVMASIQKQRRERLVASLPVNTVVVISGAQKVIRSGDQHYPFWQYADFFYLTDWPEPNALLVIIKKAHGVESILFHQGYDPVDAKWHGASMDHATACAQFAMDEALPISHFPAWQAEHLTHAQSIILLAEDKVLPMLQQTHQQIDTEVLADLLMQQRVKKQAHEMRSIKQACAITTAAHLACMQAGMRGQLTSEKALAAALYYHGMLQGAEGLAYDTIAAAGGNACVLHYTKQDAMIATGDMVLLDAGFSIGHYAADVTRTWPISGQFSQHQSEIYRIVLAAHQACLAMVKPGVSMRALQALSQDIVLDGLQQLKIVDAKASKESLFQAFYGHGVGHSLGLDVHDPSPKRHAFILEEDMVVTLEPGLYLQDSPLLIDKSFCDIGVRIEDNIWVKGNGCENLTCNLPVQIADIESLV